MVHRWSTGSGGGGKTTRSDAGATWLWRSRVLTDSASPARGRVIDRGRVSTRRVTSCWSTASYIHSAPSLPVPLSQTTAAARSRRASSPAARSAPGGYAITGRGGVDRGNLDAPVEQRGPRRLEIGGGVEHEHDALRLATRDAAHPQQNRDDERPAHSAGLP